jgi:acetyl-CoA carboxylase biotin carboxylase subunit
MHRSLLELTVDGVDTSRDFHLRMMENDAFRRGAFDIQWLEKHLDELLHQEPDRESVIRAAIAAALMADRDRSTRRVSASLGAPNGSRSPESTWLRVARQEALR